MWIMWYQHESICFILPDTSEDTGDARLTSSLLRGPFALRKGSLRRSPGFSRDFPWFPWGFERNLVPFEPLQFPFQHPSTSFNVLQHPSIPFNPLWDNMFEQIERFTYWITLIWVYLQQDVWFIPSYIVNLKLSPKPLQLTVGQTQSLSFPSIYNNSHSLFKFINERKIINNWLWANH